MAAANTDISDLDRANATITKLVSHLENYRQASQRPDLDPSGRDAEDAGRHGHLHEAKVHLYKAIWFSHFKASPVFEATLCGSFQEASKRSISPPHNDKELLGA